MNYFYKHINAILSVVLVALSAFIVISSIVFADEPKDEVISTNVNPEIATLSKRKEDIIIELTEPVVETTVQPTTKKPKETTVPQTTVEPTTEKVTIPFATAIPPRVPADYNAQWSAGYLVAIDNPDTTYQCAQVTLSDADRDLLERLCMGEFGSGGFVGASLIAQAVKNAICFDGFTSVSSVIEECRYTGRTDIPANDECKQAVKYIFDDNHDAVQHRIMYMYNPELVQSAFHESQNYILTYQSVRFFDRWGY